MDIINKYFPDLSEKQIRQFAALKELYKDWNSKINVISRKDIDLLYERHVLHSLSIGKIIQFKSETNILDVGTGGGFPGIPLAILFPDSKFYLIDSIGKKIKVVVEIAKALHLENVNAQQIRAENINTQFDFVVSRAVASFPTFHKWVKSKIKKESKNKLKNGILYLKGGDLNDELQDFKTKITSFEIAEFFTESFFETKKIIYLPF